MEGHDLKVAVIHPSQTRCQKDVDMSKKNHHVKLVDIPDLIDDENDKISFILMPNDFGIYLEEETKASQTSPIFKTRIGSKGGVDARQTVDKRYESGP